MTKPTSAKGMRDFGTEETYKRRYIFETIQSAFEKYGFSPLETPSMENLSTLTGKYGEEGDRLIFKVLNSGDYLKKCNEEDLANKDSRKLTKQISEKGMRYDLTVPFARYVAQNHGTLTFPYRRYQIQPVWRAERPQKGRYREFTQCDGDIIGDKSLVCELELLQIYEEVFKSLGLKDAKIKINNRKILAGIAEAIGKKENLQDLTIAIDKLDKIGKDKVCEELIIKGFENSHIEKLSPLFSKSFDELKNLVSITEIGKVGLEELEELLDLTKSVSLEQVEFDPLLARGLDYYTGTIVEVICEESGIGSLGGGGRYDNLTDIFGVKDLSGVGISFGADRIYLVLEQRSLFPKNTDQKTQAFIPYFSSNTLKEHLKLAQMLREAGVNTETYPSPAKMKKQLKYANSRLIPYVLMQGEDEIKSGQITLKNMQTGEQSLTNLKDLIGQISSS